MCLVIVPSGVLLCLWFFSYVFIVFIMLSLFVLGYLLFSFCTRHFIWKKVEIIRSFLSEFFFSSSFRHLGIQALLDYLNPIWGTNIISVTQIFLKNWVTIIEDQFTFLLVFIFSWYQSKIEAFIRAFHTGRALDTYFCPPSPMRFLFYFYLAWLGFIPVGFFIPLRIFLK